jgi:anthraniloyl-CoA monooxygenase
VNVICVGGGPAGLYVALLLKKALPLSRIRVVDRNRPYETFGWGVVFSDATLGNLREADRETYDAIVEQFVHWDDIDIRLRGQTARSGGHGFCGIGRKKLVNILQQRAEALGVELEFEREVTTLDPYADADVLVAADGIKSRVRGMREQCFAPDLQHGRCRFVWLGTALPLDAFTFIFEQTDCGWFTAHAYRFDACTSTFIVECREETWLAHGLDKAGTAATVAFCERLFARHLEGRPLLANSPHLRGRDWQRFTNVSNANWVSDERIVLLGDAAHSAHFSVGSGTKLAMEDAVALQRALCEERGVGAALARYESERRVEVLRLQNAARNSREWFENVARYARLPFEQFTYSLLTRSQRIGHENLRVRDAAYVDRVERRLAPRGSAPAPPMFTPFQLRSLRLANRIVVSPMDMYSATDGMPNEFHLVHLGSRAMGGAGLVYTEMTCVSADGRITPGCTGMYEPGHVEGWKRIVQYVHRWSGAKICLQLGHSGPKGSTKLMWEGMDEPLDAGNWTVCGPSAVAYGPGSHLPKELTRPQMDTIRDRFVRAVHMAIESGFDMLELHCAHGYLLSSFITPLQNRRLDAYGGSLENRLRYPLEVFTAMRNVWPADRPMSVRISATDWHVDGISEDDGVAIARAFKDAGVDIIDVSTGQTSPAARPVYGRMFQTPYADRVRNDVGVATMAVGNIYEADQVNSIIAAGRADLCALGRPHLADPYWTLHAAAQLGYPAAAWPIQYLPGKTQLERNLSRAGATAATL